jgi:hypothetical protein
MARLSERAYFLWLQAGRPEGRSEEFWEEAVRLEGHLTDIDAIFTVIGRRSAENRQREKDRGWHFDLRGTYPSTLPSVFERGFLANAHLEGANLLEAHLEGADLRQAHLEGADLRKAHFEGANLWSAHLEGADLREAHFEGANLVGAHLEGADFSKAKGLTDDKLVLAHGDGKTKLPEGITRPKSWPPLVVGASPLVPF